MPKFEKREYRIEEKAAYFEERRKEKEVILAELEQGVKDIYTSGKYEEYLTAMSRFHNYSLGNLLRIQKQNPEAYLIAGFNTWKEQGRYVLRGEKALKILAPHFKLEPQFDNNNQPIRTPDGKQLYKKEVDYFTWKNVFDVSQTDGKPLPEIVNPLDGNVENYNKVLETLIEISPVPVAFEQINDGSLGYFHLTGHRIAIQKDMNEPTTLRTLVHEISHAHLHNKENGIEKDKDRRTREVQAESVAFVVCKHLKIDTGDSSFGYIAEWGKDKNYPQLKESLDVIRKCSDEIIQSLDEKLLGIEFKKYEVDEDFGNEKTDVKEPEKIIKTKQEKEKNYSQTYSNLPQNRTEYYTQNQYKTEPKAPKKFTAWEEKSEQARSANLVEYFQRNNYTLQKNGAEYYIKEINGLCINPQRNSWFSHYEGFGGNNSVDCLTKILGKDFKTAVEELAGFSHSYSHSSYRPEYKNYTPQTPKTEPKIFTVPERANNNNRVFAYLVKTRKIPPQIVAQYIKVGKIYQDKEYGNAVFPHMKNGKMVGAELQGTCSGKRFKGIATGTDKSVFSVTFSKEVKRAYIFESAIDLMSFHALMSGKNDLNGVALISMGGLKHEVIKAIEQNGIEIISCVDNDERGRKFEADHGFKRGCDVLEKEGVKDWNELLQRQVEKDFQIEKEDKSVIENHQYARENNVELDVC